MESGVSIPTVYRALDQNRNYSFSAITLQRMLQALEAKIVFDESREAPDVPMPEPEPLVPYG